MRPFLFPRKFRHGFSVSESSTRINRTPRVSIKKSSVLIRRSECFWLWLCLHFRYFCGKKYCSLIKSFIICCMQYSVKQTNKHKSQQLITATYWLLPSCHLPKPVFILFLSREMTWPLFEMHLVICKYVKWMDIFEQVFRKNMKQTFFCPLFYFVYFKILATEARKNLLKKLI